MPRPVTLLVVAGALLALAACAQPETTEPGTTAAGEPRSATQAAGDMVLATTTSTVDSGLLDALVPAFESTSQCTVKTVAVGSGQALTMGERGDADALLVHSPEAEQDFMRAGHGSGRKAVMHNDFVIVGPRDDPAGVAGAKDSADAVRRIARTASTFASRADYSGTHTKEMSLWRSADLDPRGASWYVETGQGMGATLTIAAQKLAYALADRGTYLSMQNLESDVLFEGDAALRNDYHVVVVQHDGTNVACAEEFSSWVTAPDAQQLIAGFGVDRYGQPLFFPDGTG